MSSITNPVLSAIYFRAQQAMQAYRHEYLGLPRWVILEKKKPASLETGSFALAIIRIM